MSGWWIKTIANSKDAALVMSLLFNVIACGAIWRLWKSKEALQDRVTNMLGELLKELTRLTANLAERGR